MLGHKKCSIPGCLNRAVAKGKCGSCYARIRYNTDPSHKEKRLAASKKWRRNHFDTYFNREEKRKARADRLNRRKNDPELFLIIKYDGMKSRTNGVGGKPHLYHGLDIMTKGEFVKKSLECPKFNEIYKNWQDSGFRLKDTPTPDRVDSKIGYVWSNIEWVTHSINSSRGARSQWGTL